MNIINYLDAFSGIFESSKNYRTAFSRGCVEKALQVPEILDNKNGTIRNIDPIRGD